MRWAAATAAVPTHSAELHAGQARGLDQTLAKAERELDKISQVLGFRPGSAHPRTTRHRHRQDYPQAVGPRPAHHHRHRRPPVHLSADLARRRPGPHRPGRTPVRQNASLITDRHTWTTTEVIAQAISPNPTPSSASRGPRTPTWSSSARCATGPSTTSAYTPSTASSR